MLQYKRNKAHHHVLLKETSHHVQVGNWLHFITTPHLWLLSYYSTTLSVWFVTYHHHHHSARNLILKVSTLCVPVFSPSGIPRFWKQASHTLTGVSPHPLSGTGLLLDEQPSQKPSPHARQWCFVSLSSKASPHLEQLCNISPKAMRNRCEFLSFR